MGDRAGGKSAPSGGSHGKEPEQRGCVTVQRAGHGMEGWAAACPSPAAQVRHLVLGEDLASLPKPVL